ncbi:MAG TPA: S41 family peptidase [Aggregatilineales bacterium]|nr:S41 family peptidase [Aggregatilineales bacterium]
MSRTRNLISVLLVVAMAFGVGYFVGQQPDTAPVSAQTQTTEEIFAPLFEIYDIVNQRYIDPLDSETLMIGAIDGMMEAIGDENTNYLEPEEFESWNQSLSNEFEGIGATVNQDEETGALTIISPLPGSPAEAAGLLPGDQIVEVGGEDITGFDQTEIISRVRGPAGSIVRLGIRREGEAELIEFTVIRDRIELPDVEYRVLPNNVGYVRLYGFTDDTTNKLRDALIEIDAEHLSGLVLDLRNNPGGFLETSLQVISQFVNEGPILIEQLPGDQERVFEATGDASAPTVPLAVLVDAGSASASELVAGALKDRERAVIVGMPTFGKATVQTINPVSTGGAVRVTIARWVTPDGESVEPDGLVPDVEIEFDPESDPEMDNQLSAAIRALKGMQREQISLPVPVG